MNAMTETENAYLVKFKAFATYAQERADTTRQVYAVWVNPHNANMYAALLTMANHTIYSSAGATQVTKFNPCR